MYFNEPESAAIVSGGVKLVRTWYVGGAIVQKGRYANQKTR